MDEVTVRPLETDDMERAVSVQVMAFGSDPVMRWFYREPHDYLQNFPPFVRAFGGLAFEHGTGYEAGGFGGISLWLPPGVHIDPAPLGQHFNDSLDEATRDGAFAMLEQMDRHHIEEPHWYLAIIGVDPSHQGKGIGGALLRHSVTRCDEEGMPAYLESSNPANVPLYERHGFEVITEIQVADSPVVYPMLRTPK